ncbi:MAG: hypothetical protein ACP5KE_06655 [Candidatus Methanodesulfokora sp.]
MIVEKGGKLRVKEVAERLGVEEQEVMNLWLGFGKVYGGVHLFQEDDEFVLCTSEWIGRLVAKALDEARDTEKKRKRIGYMRRKERVEENLEGYL